MHAQRWWWNVTWLLKLNRAYARLMARFYLAIVQALLLYRADSWKITNRDFAALALFHKRAVRRITGEHIWQDARRVWHYHNHNALLQRCRLWPIAPYIERRCGTLHVYLQACRPEILEEVWLLRTPACDPH